MKYLPYLLFARRETLDFKRVVFHGSTSPEDLWTRADAKSAAIRPLRATSVSAFAAAAVRFPAAEPSKRPAAEKAFRSLTTIPQMGGAGAGESDLARSLLEPGEDRDQRRTIRGDHGQSQRAEWKADERDRERKRKNARAAPRHRSPSRTTSRRPDMPTTGEGSRLRRLHAALRRDGRENLRDSGAIIIAKTG
jgi:hypothetical protein